MVAPAAVGGVFGSFSLSGWLKPLGATAAAVGVGLAVAAVLLRPEAQAPMPVVRWIDGGERNVMVLDGTANTTIIWVVDDSVEGASSSPREARREVV